MDWLSLLKNLQLPTYYIVLLTFAFCFIINFFEHHRVKTHNFKDIAEAIEKRNTSHEKMIETYHLQIKKIKDQIDHGDSLPEIMEEYRYLFIKYSLELDSYMSFYTYLRKDKRMIKIRGEECWNVMKSYLEIFHLMKETCEYSEIVSMVEFIKLGGVFEKFRVYQFLKREGFGKGILLLKRSFF